MSEKSDDDARKERKASGGTLQDEIRKMIKSASRRNKKE